MTSQIPMPMNSDFIIIERQDHYPCPPEYDGEDISDDPTVVVVEVMLINTEPTLELSK